MESASVANEPVIASISEAAQAINLRGWCDKSQAKNKDNNQRINMNNRLVYLVVQYR